MIKILRCNKLRSN